MGFLGLLKQNRNYRWLWTGQVVSEVGDHFNNIAVFSLAIAMTKSGLVVAGIMLSRAIPMMLAGPIAGVLLDRMDRKKLMIISDLIRFVVALLFVATLTYRKNWLLYVLSGLLMFASPFFTSGRAAILPSIASREELHAANSLTQATQWTTVAVGSFLAGATAAQFGYELAFILNAFSFLFSAFCVSRLKSPTGMFRAPRRDLSEDKVVRPWHEYAEGLRYMRSNPLLLGIALVGVGWATGGGAAQILFSLFGDIVFDRGPSGIGMMWGCSGCGLVAGAMVAHKIGKTISFPAYKRLVTISYLIHGGAYVIFSQMPTFGGALLFIAISRFSVAIASVLNFSEMLKHVADEYRGRVFSTMETMSWSMQMLSMTAAGAASDHYTPRAIGAVAGVLSATTGIFWAMANWSGKLPEPPIGDVDPEDIAVHGDDKA